jgi:hypothetical protein
MAAPNRGQRLNVYLRRHVWLLDLGAHKSVCAVRRADTRGSSCEARRSSSATRASPSLSEPHRPAGCVTTTTTAPVSRPPAARDGCNQVAAGFQAADLCCMLLTEFVR